VRERDESGPVLEHEPKRAAKEDVTSRRLGEGIEACGDTIGTGLDAACAKGVLATIVSP